MSLALLKQKQTEGEQMKEEANIVDAEIVDESSSQTSSPQEEKATDLKTNILCVEHWLRCLFMILFSVIASVASYVIFVLVVIQFLFTLITGKPEQRLRFFGNSLTQYITQILQFLTYNSEQKPFPFSDWPTPDVTDSDS